MTEKPYLTEKLARWSQALAGIAQTGLAYSTNPYDAERFEEILKLAAEIAAATNAPAIFDPALAEQIQAHWRQQVVSGAKGYVTPKVSVGAISFNNRDEILLVQNAESHDWCFPVGLADIGYAPSEVARKEVREEAGLDVTPLHLMGVSDSFKAGFNPEVHIYNLLFYCRLDGGELGPQTVEISYPLQKAGETRTELVEVRWFRQAQPTLPSFMERIRDFRGWFFKCDSLPSPLVLDGKPWVQNTFDWHSDVHHTPYFD